jgi:hypothetical protein
VSAFDKGTAEQHFFQPCDLLGTVKLHELLRDWTLMPGDPAG